MQKTQYKQGHKAYAFASSEASNEFSQKSQLIAQLERNGHIAVKTRGVALENLTIIKQGKRFFLVICTLNLGQTCVGDNHYANCLHLHLLVL